MYHRVFKKKTFNSLTFVENNNIIEKGRPKSHLKLDTVSKGGGKKVFTHHFHQTIPWICGCSDLCKLFCWSYFLPSMEKITWFTKGYDDLHNLHKSEERHTNSAAHILAMKTLELFGKNGGKLNLVLVNRTNYRYKTTIKRWKNRAILTLSIRVVCLLGEAWDIFSWTLWIRYCISVNRGNYIKFKKVLGIYVGDLKNVIKNKGIFRGLFPQIQNDVIASVSK